MSASTETKPTCKSGIYSITNAVNGMVYVGQAINIDHRWRDHRRALTTGKHENDKLQKAWVKYGPDAFAFDVLERCSAARLDEREQHWMDTTGCYERDGGYNIARCAASPMRGRSHTAESRAKISAGGLGLVRSPETRALISAANAGKPKSPSHRAALSAARTGFKPAPFSDKHRKALSEAAKRRWARKALNVPVGEAEPEAA